MNFLYFIQNIKFRLWEIIRIFNFRKFANVFELFKDLYKSFSDINYQLPD